MLEECQCHQISLPAGITSLETSSSLIGKEIYLGDLNVSINEFLLKVVNGSFIALISSWVFPRCYYKATCISCMSGWLVHRSNMENSHTALPVQQETMNMIDVNRHWVRVGRCVHRKLTNRKVKDLDFKAAFGSEKLSPSLSTSDKYVQRPFSSSPVPSFQFLTIRLLSFIVHLL